MVQVQRKPRTIHLTQAVEELPPPAPPTLMTRVRALNIPPKQALIASGILFVFLFTLFLIWPSQNLTPPDAEILLQLQSEQQRLRAEVSQLQAELGARQSQQALPESSSSAAITPREFMPDGSERDDPFLGPKDSELLVMVFTDFQCRLCREFHLGALPQIRSEFAEKGAAKLVLRDFPLQSSSHARKAAAFAHCAGEQGEYWKAFDVLNADEKALSTGDFSKLLPKLKGIDLAALGQCLRSKRYESEIDRDVNQAVQLGARGAPATFVGTRTESGAFSGVFIRGAQPFPVIEQEIRRAQSAAAALK